MTVLIRQSTDRARLSRVPKRSLSQFAQDLPRPQRISELVLPGIPRGRGSVTPGDRHRVPTEPERGPTPCGLPWQAA